MDKCQTCLHNDVCCKKDAYKEAYEKVNNDISDFEVELKCKHFKSSIENALEKLKYSSPGIYKKIINPYPNYPQPYIGDPLLQPITTWYGGDNIAP